MTRNNKQKKKSEKRALEISETLIRFAAPLMEFFGPDIPPETLREIFMIATTVWNAVVLEQLGRRSHFVNELKEQMSEPDMFFMRELIKVLIEQKRMRFADDLRMIRHQEVVFNSDDSRLFRFEARSDFERVQ